MAVVVKVEKLPHDEVLLFGVVRGGETKFFHELWLFGVQLCLHQFKLIDFLSALSTVQCLLETRMIHSFMRLAES